MMVGDYMGKRGVSLSILLLVISLVDGVVGVSCPCSGWSSSLCLLHDFLFRGCIVVVSNIASQT